MQNSLKSTNYPIEFMRIAGVILITFTHIKHDFTTGTVFFVLEDLPKFGTMVLSVISGYLYYNYRYDANLLSKKIKSLLIPYLIANIAVLLPVLLIKATGYNFLNRLTYDSSLITEGLFALTSPPINPPTYFIRDLFIIFCFLSLIHKDYRALLFILPLLFFGKIFIRLDVVLLFIIGFISHKFSWDTANPVLKNILLAAVIALSYFFLKEYDFYKYAIALCIFLNVVNLKFSFIKTGAYTYFLHLYHSPVIIFIFPALNLIYPNPYFLAASQIILAISICYAMFRVIKKLNWSFVVGNRF
ncbi:hypothetical protein GR160_12785 [Flavobacterium sp. Sd200]|uniref:hypothetical protein n=1 Tax=Flavobacterium sp. Sd200 TaxID=2692211 RepID=UPI00136FE080|nr:hypothetical protein [Flavobacterium sp. Sd200]MXN92102.1 hypothetical protein [Flavobacterium sp. Sd200]